MSLSRRFPSENYGYRFLGGKCQFNTLSPFDNCVQCLLHQRDQGVRVPAPDGESTIVGEGLGCYWALPKEFEETFKSQVPNDGTEDAPPAVCP